MMARVDNLPGGVDWLVSQDDDLEMTVAFTDDGVAYSAGGNLWDVGVAGDWSAGVWKSQTAASLFEAALVSATVTVPSAGHVKVAIAKASVYPLDPDVTYWWALVRATRRTVLVGRFVFSAGVAEVAP